MLLFTLLGFGLFRERRLRTRLQTLVNERRGLEAECTQKADELEDQPTAQVRELGNSQRSTAELGSDSTLLIPQIDELDGDPRGCYRCGAGSC